MNNRFFKEPTPPSPEELAQQQAEQAQRKAAIAAAVSGVGGTPTPSPQESIPQTTHTVVATPAPETQPTLPQRTIADVVRAASGEATPVAAKQERASDPFAHSLYDQYDSSAGIDELAALKLVKGEEFYTERMVVIYRERLARARQAYQDWQLATDVPASERLNTHAVRQERLTIISQSILQGLLQDVTGPDPLTTCRLLAERTEAVRNALRVLTDDKGYDTLHHDEGSAIPERLRWARVEQHLFNYLTARAKEIIAVYEQDATQLRDRENRPVDPARQLHHLQEVREAVAAQSKLFADGYELVKKGKPIPHSIVNAATSLASTLSEELFGTTTIATESLLRGYPELPHQAASAIRQEYSR